MTWQPIETIPKDGSVVVIYTPHGRKHHFVCGYYYEYAPGVEMYLDRTGRPITSPTYWMKLEKPTEEKQK